MLKLIYVLLGTAFVNFGISAYAMEGTGLQISAAADIAGQFGLHTGSGASDRLSPREVEIGFYAPADHLFDGAINFAAHFEGNGIPTVELHEGYVGSSKLIPRSRFKLGFFFLGVGRINQTHRHDWPFITGPKYHERFFAAEGALDSGLEYSYLLPIPFFLELTAGITNGFTFGHDHTAGARPLFPTHYLRLLTYSPLGKGGAQVGLNYLGRTDDTGERTALFGVDFAAKWRESTQVKFLLQSEIWYRTQSPRTGSVDNEFGLYVFPEYHLGNNLFLGLRIDYFTDLKMLDPVTGSTIKNFDLNFVPTLSYKASHFSTVRLAMNFDSHYERNGIQKTGKYVEIQSIFILGAHPAHDF